MEGGASTLIANKKHFRELVLRYGYYLPNSSFCSVAYMHGVLGGSMYYPKYKEVRLLPCPRPPPKPELLAAVQTALARNGKTIGDTSRLCPDAKWLLAVLSTLNPHHLFFRRNYQPPPRVRKLKE